MRVFTTIGLLGVLLSARLFWVSAPLSGSLDAALPVAWPAFGIALLGLAAGVLRHAPLAAAAGVAGLGLCSVTLSHLALQDPSFWLLVDENQQYIQMDRFTSHLPTNRGTPSTFKDDLATETLAERLSTATYFMGVGWWLHLIGSFALLIGGLSNRRHSTQRYLAFATLAVIAAHGIIGFKGMMAYDLLARSVQHLAHGRYVDVIAHINTAQRQGAPLAGDVHTHIRLGLAYWHLGQKSHAAGQFYLAEQQRRVNRFDDALIAYQLALRDASIPLRQTVQKRLAWLYVQMGLHRYRNGRFGEVVPLWEKALQTDPTQLQAIYFLSRAYFLLRQYPQSIAMGLDFLQRSHSQLLNANVQANIGDSYWELKDMTRARQAYTASLRLDRHGNYRIFKSLGGT